MEKEKFIKIVKQSKTLTDVVKGLGLRCAGGNYKTIKKYIDLYELDTTHFDSEIIRIEKMKQYFETNKKSLTEILVKDSIVSRKTIKERLYREGLKKHECELCGQGEEWRGKKMSLILDHKNGVYNDNRLENLRIVCPNCNATLDTHCGKQNSKRNKKLKEMNQPDNIDLRTVLTPARLAFSLKRRKVERPSYHELINEIELNGYSATGRKYGVSDNAIRKWLK